MNTSVILDLDLRAHIATQALCGLCANPRAWDLNDENVVKAALSLADTLIASLAEGSLRKQDQAQADAGVICDIRSVVKNSASTYEQQIARIAEILEA